MKILEERDLITEFDEENWVATVEKVIVRSASEMVFTFKDGSEVVWGI